MTNLSNEFSINELDGVSGGKSLGDGIFSTTIGGFTFTYNTDRGALTVSAGKTFLECEARPATGVCSVIQ